MAQAKRVFGSVDPSVVDVLKEKRQRLRKERKEQQ